MLSQTPLVQVSEFQLDLVVGLLPWYPPVGIHIFIHVILRRVKSKLNTQDALKQMDE